MKSILLPLLLIISSVKCSQQPSFVKLKALDSKYPIEIGEKYASEIECIKKLDKVLKARWTDELNEIPTTDLGILPNTPWEERESIYTKYNTMEDEWLMEEGSPTQKIDQCVQNVLSVANNPLTIRGELECVNALLSTHISDETHHLLNFERLLNSNTSREQIPFLKFISFSEFVNLIYQNRKPNAWSNLEKLVYAHAKSYMVTDADKIRSNYFLSRNCDWRNAVALQDAPTPQERLNEFSSQVRRTVNKLLGAVLVKNWNLNVTLPRNKYDLWLKARRDMMAQLEREVDALRRQSRDSNWLCEYAAELALNFTNIQAGILLTEKSTVHFEASDVASKARTIEVALENFNDTRHATTKIIADKLETGTRCLSSLLRIVQNHRRYELASAFMDQEYVYPELFCENSQKNPGLIRLIFCNCIGTFCVSHDLTALFEEEYVLVKGSDGIYKIVRSGVRSNRKVTHCHTLANSNRT